MTDIAAKRRHNLPHASFGFEGVKSPQSVGFIQPANAQTRPPQDASDDLQKEKAYKKAVKLDNKAT